MAAARTLAIRASSGCQVHCSLRENNILSDSDAFGRDVQPEISTSGLGGEILLLILETFVRGRAAGNRGTMVIVFWREKWKEHSVL